MAKAAEPKAERAELAKVVRKSLLESRSFRACFFEERIRKDELVKFRRSCSLILLCTAL